MECKSKSIQSSSSSSTTRRYDVFVSFRGEDTRFNFVDHLFGAFQRKGIVAFRDATNLKQGDHISTELMEAIEGSQVLIVVFSKNYATSSWCLQELAKIVDCMNTEVPTGQSVLPVFYDVSPSEVRKQSGDYGKAFAEHEERFKQNLDMVQRWREALVQMASVSGWDVHNKPQFGETEKIVKRVMSILGNKISYLPKDLVGMHSHVDELEKFLVLDSVDDFQVVGIWGMGGIGKTTLARVLYHRFSHQYDASCFIDDVSKVYHDHGLLGVQKQLYCQILNEENQEVWNICKATYLTRTILSKVKVFIVLDNVDEVTQLEGLAINREFLCAGSKIIVVSRNKHILDQFGVNKVYQVQCLNEDHALQLFCRKAFKCDYIMREYEVLTNRALAYAQGHPLSITVLGSFLFNREISEWISALDRLRDNPKSEIMDILRISFDGLEQIEKEIFLDIACFFTYEEETTVKRILDCCGFYPNIGIRVLIDKSLITINQLGGIIMHAMLVELGRKIVREKAPNEPRKWSRLWRCKDFQKVLIDKMVIEDVEAINLKGNPVKMRTLRAEVLSEMSHLRLLILEAVNFTGSLYSLSNKLQYLQWHQYPFIYLPSTFEPTELVELALPFGNIKTLCEDTQALHNLRIMNLQYSKNLIRTPNFRGLPNLEQLNLEGCSKLVEIHQSIGLLRKLVDLNLKNCTSLKSLPYNIFGLSSLKVLNLFGCSKLFNNQLLEDGRHAELLNKHDVSEDALKWQSTSSILQKFSFQFFSSVKKKDIVGLLLPSFPCMQDLDISFCNLYGIPDAIGCLHGLKRLNLGGNNFVSLPSGIKELLRLKSLNLQHCKQLKYLLDLPLGTDFPIRQELVHGEYIPAGIPAGLYIFNSPRLIEMESWSCIALSWMIQVLQVHTLSLLPSFLALSLTVFVQLCVFWYQVHHKSCPPIDEVEIVVPGSQVPRWFNHQSVGKSTKLELFPLHSSNCIGVALCAAFVVALDHSTNLDVSTRHPIYFAMSYKSRRAFSTPIPLVAEKDLVKVELDHLFILYWSRENLIRVTSWLTEEKCDLDGAEVEVSFDIIPEDRDRYPLWLVAKKWGFRWVFQHDLELEELTPTMTDDDWCWIEPFPTKMKPLLNN